MSHALSPSATLSTHTKGRTNTATRQMAALMLTATEATKLRALHNVDQLLPRATCICSEPSIALLGLQVIKSDPASPVGHRGHEQHL